VVHLAHARQRAAAHARGREPTHERADLTASMPITTYDVVVVGASLGGVAAAIRAAALGANVGVLEAGT